MGIGPVRTVIYNYATAHKLRLMNHPNDEASKLVEEVTADDDCYGLGHWI